MKKHYIIIAFIFLFISPTVFALEKDKLGIGKPLKWVCFKETESLGTNNGQCNKSIIFNSDTKLTISLSGEKSEMKDWSLKQENYKDIIEIVGDKKYTIIVAPEKSGKEIMSLGYVLEPQERDSFTVKQYYQQEPTEDAGQHQ